ncbi:MAG: patatin-like phospholipase family protein [Gaiellaceae bacterium]
MPEQTKADATSPVEAVDTGKPERLEQGIALCLSGGGYRAMLFHVGAVWRLNELGYLPRLDRISSVSGGSIAAAVLGMNWSALQTGADGVAGNLDEQYVQPLRELASRTIDEGSIVEGFLTPGSIADKVADAYRKHLFGNGTLQALPDRPRFVINATNVQTGALWRFSKPYMADYRVGTIPNPTEELAVAVAASSAFPPILSPMRFEVDPDRYDPATKGDLHQPPFTTDIVLADGGVYDNLGLETAWKRYETVLVSDGGGQMAPEAEPHRDWARHALRINSLIDNQVRSLRKRQVVAGFQAGDRTGTYWGIRGDVSDYGPAAGTLPCPHAATLVLAKTKTRLKRMDAVLQERLINWGYAICDVAMRRWVEPGAVAPAGFPYPAAGVG